MNWYYAEAGQQAGPVTEAEFLNLVSIGRIQPNTLVWREGMASWQPYQTVRAPSASAAASPVAEQAAAAAAPAANVPASASEVVCAECGQLFSRENVIPYGAAWVCAACKPIFVQKIKEGATLPGQVMALPYAGFWIRVLAKLIDIAIFMVVLGVPFVIFLLKSTLGSSSGPPSLAEQLGLQVIGQLIVMAVIVGYNTFFHGKYGATLGKMACRLRVVTADGAPITYLRAFGRAWAEQLSGMICDIGYIIAAFDREKRSLHDHMCNTRVIRK